MQTAEINMAAIHPDDTGAGEPSALAKQHRVLTAPAVVLLGERGQELRRYEGESCEAVSGLRADLAKNAAAKR